MIRSIYSKIRKGLPNKWKGELSKFIFDYTGKPYVRKNEKKHDLFPGSDATGGLIFSADFELAWAFRYSKRNNDYIGFAKQERKNFPFILSVLEKYNIPVTWATVGHLFLENCHKSDHDWMARIPHFDDHWKFMQGDWFDHDPGTDWKTDNAWYAPDLINNIISSKTKHEIGCHTFSHIDCSYKNCPPEVIDDELKACSKVAESYGCQLKSLVFPGGTAGNYEILKKNGYKIYRKNIDVDLAYPFLDDFGMLVTPTSSGLGDNGLGWTKDYFIKRFKKYIDKAIKTKTVCHFWFHPSIDEWFLHEIFPPILEYADQKRSEGKLWVGTMGDIASHILSTKK